MMKKSLICILLFAMVLGGCAFSPMSQAEKTVCDVMEAIIENNLSKASEHCDLSSLLSEEDNTESLYKKIYSQTLFSEIKYEILQSSETENGEVVKVKISAKDSTILLSPFMLTYARVIIDNGVKSEEEKKSDDTVNQELANELKKLSENVGMYDSEIELLVKEDNTFECTDAFKEALFGGMQTAIETEKAKSILDNVGDTLTNKLKEYQAE